MMEDKDLLDDDLFDKNSTDSFTAMSFNNSETSVSSSISSWNQTNSSNSTQSHNNASSSSSSLAEVRFEILLYMLVPFMFVLCLRPSSSSARHRMFMYEDVEEEERRRQHRQQHERENEKKQGGVDVEERKRMVKDSLVTMIVASRDEESGAVLTLSSDTSIPLQQSEEKTNNNQQLQQDQSDNTNDYDDETLCSCMICLEPYEINEEVSYFKQSALHCRHVFHRECITDWLMRQDDCPCCRTPYIQQQSDVDRNQTEQTNEQHEQHVDVEHGICSPQPQQQNNNETNDVLYIVDGLISKTPKISNCTTHPPLLVSISDKKTQEGDSEQHEVRANNSIAHSQSCQQQHADAKEGTDAIEQDENQITQGTKKRKKRSSLFSRGHHPRVTVYTSVSVHEDELLQDGQQLDNEIKREEMMMDGDEDKRDDSDTETNINVDHV